MPSLSTKVELERLQKFCVAKMTDTQPSVWLAVNDIEEEGTWKDSLTGQPLNYTPAWADGQPNGGARQNCVDFCSCHWFCALCSQE